LIYDCMEGDAPADTAITVLGAESILSKASGSPNASRTDICRLGYNRVFVASCITLWK
jgi:hypothetical protein